MTIVIEKLKKTTEDENGNKNSHQKLQIIRQKERAL